MDIPRLVKEHMDALGTLRLLSVRPIIEPDPHGDPLPSGSGVLLRYKHEHFLVSAAHVVDRPNVSLYVGTQTSWKELPHPYHFTASPTPSAGDTFDVGFVHLPPDLAASLDGCEFLDEPDIDFTERPTDADSAGSLYLALGWPQNRFSFNWRARSTNPENLGYLGPGAPADRYQSLSLDPRLHLLITFDDKKAVMSSGKIGKAQKLHGMSGGGVWRVRSFATGDPSSDKLVALTVRREPDMGCLVATRLAVVFAALQERLDAGTDA